LHNRKIALFQGQIETALKKFAGELDLRMKDLFGQLHIQSHLTAAGIRKCEGFPPVHLLFVLTNAVFLHIKNVCDLLTQPLRPPLVAHPASPVRPALPTTGHVMAKQEAPVVKTIK